MANYIFIKDELKPHNQEIGTTKKIKLIDFLKTLDLVNPSIKLNDKDIKISDDEYLVDKDYILKDDDNLLVVNQVGWEYVITIVISLVVSYALTSLLKPDKPTIPTNKSQEKGQTEFTVNTSQNQARNGEPIPECFGNFVRIPDLISAPYRRYDGNQQYLYMILCIGVGENTINNVLIEDTDVTEFTSGTIDYKVYKNATAHTGNDKIKDDWNTTYTDPYMRDVVVTGKEISDYKLSVATPFNAIQLNDISTLTDYIEFDIVFHNGLFSQNSDGTLASRSVTVRFTIIDSVGGITTHDEIISGNSRNQIRRTFGYSVTPDYYKTKADRITADSTDTKINDEVTLETMKAYLINNDVTGDGFIQYGDLTLMAVKIKATEGVSSRGQFKVKVKGQRDGLTNLKSIMEYIWTSENGGRQNISDIDLPITMTETYNAVIDNRTTVYKALQSVATAKRYNVFPSFNIITARKDEPQAVRTMLFNETNMVKDSLRITTNSKDETDYDGVRVVYKDADTFEDRYATYPIDSSFPESKDLDGITDPTFAAQQAEFLYKQDRFRNVKYVFDTELDGHVPSLFSRVGITHPTISASQSGIIVDFTLDTVTLNETVKESYINPKIMFRSRTGQTSSLYTITNITGRTLTIDVSLNPLPTDFYIGDDEQKTVYALGESVEYVKDIIITEMKPKKNNVVSMVGWNYNESVYPA